MNVHTSYRSYLIVGLLSACILGLSGCWSDKSHRNYEYAPNMFYSLPLEPYSQTVGEDGEDGKHTITPTGLSIMKTPEGTVPRSASWYNEEAYTPYHLKLEDYERSATEIFSPLEDPDSTSGYNCTEETYNKGKELYKIFCEVCHGTAGDGMGILAQKKKIIGIPSYLTAEGVGLKNLEEGKMFHSITYGKGKMGSYASQLTPKERWMVICYIQEFQKSEE